MILITLSSVDEFRVDVQLPDFSINKIEFRVPCNIGDPNYYNKFVICYITFDNRFKDKVWIEAYNDNFIAMFSNFYLATNFVIYTNHNVCYTNNTWDNEKKTMVLDY